MANGNPFYVDPTGGVDLSRSYANLGQAISGFGQLQRQREKESQAEEAKNLVKQRVKQGSAAIKDAMGDPVKMAQAMIDYPELQKTAETAFGFTNDVTKGIASDTYSKVLSDPENAVSYLSEGIEKVRSAGGNPQNMMNDLQSFQSDPESALQSVELGVAAIAPDVYKAYSERRKATQKATPKPMTEYERRTLELKEKDQGLRGLDIEQKRLQSELSRETNELKKKEIQTRIDKTKAEIEQKGKQIEVDQRESISTTESALDSVDSLLNHPGLDWAVGGTSVFPTVPGSDAADFEVQLESFVGQLTMENMGKMKGVLSDSDIKMLRSASSGLSTKMDETTFKKRLNKIKDRLQQKLEVIPKDSASQQDEATQYTEGQTATNPATGEKLIFRGGKWQRM